jgi:hypothetical protein
MGIRWDEEGKVSTIQEQQQRQQQQHTTSSGLF